ncbi:hypothetical protein [Natranaerofaba carboxydovora]|uniref:hypothetical protein n=1 Tax=Natranaerofaba carboxydovora TaxID=2742683 RepID=UPI001F138920|nr:hypothetical protein [Natranaerofaba carboxydovora]UMZ74102.1 hypothetical protein ACONDI_01681 [Natranaerofaba carboxydovora]
MYANDSNEIEKKINESCLTEDFCGECQESKCPVGFMREVCEGKIDKDNYDQVTKPEPSPRKDLERDQLVDSLAEILGQCQSCEINHYETCDINLLRQGVEVAIFEDSLEYPGNVKKYLDNLSGSVPELVEVLRAKLESQ